MGLLLLLPAVAIWFTVPRCSPSCTAPGASSAHLTLLVLFGSSPLSSTPASVGLTSASTNDP